MNVALIGSASSSVCTLEALLKGGVEVSAVLGVDTSHRSRVSDYHDLWPIAERAGVPFHSFVKVTEPEVARFLQAHPADLLWVIGLSQLVPKELLGLARHAGVGFHPTKLPKGRGRAPVAWTILLNQPAAANLFFLSDEPDAGDIIMQRPVPVLPDDYSEDLIRRTNVVLHQMVLDLAPLIRSGRLPRHPQDHSQATYYLKRTAQDGLIDWNQTTDAIYRLIRAAGRPYHGAFTYSEGKKLIIWRAKPVLPDRLGSVDHNAPGGTVVLADDSSGCIVRSANGFIQLTELQHEASRAREYPRLAAGTLLCGLDGAR